MWIKIVCAFVWPGENVALTQRQPNPISSSWFLCLIRHIIWFNIDDIFRVLDIFNAFFANGTYLRLSLFEKNENYPSSTYTNVLSTCDTCIFNKTHQNQMTYILFHTIANRMVQFLKCQSFKVLAQMVPLKHFGWSHIIRRCTDNSSAGKLD